MWFIRYFACCQKNWQPRHLPPECRTPNANTECLHSLSESKMITPVQLPKGLSWSHWINNFTTTAAPSREVAAAGAMSLGRLEKLLVTGPQISCLPVAVTINPIPPTHPVRISIIENLPLTALSLRVVAAKIGFAIPFPSFQLLACKSITRRMRIGIPRRLLDSTAPPAPGALRNAICTALTAA